MKFRVINLSFILLFLAVSAYGQKGIANAVKPEATPAVASLKTLRGTQRYTDPEKAFSIWMPDKPKSIVLSPPDPVKGFTKTTYEWEVAEGFLGVTKTHYEQRTFDTEAVVATLVGAIKDGVGKDPDTKFVSDKPFANGKWRGADMIFSSGEWIKTIIRMQAAGHEVYLVVITVNDGVPDAEKLLLKSADSLEIK